ncbi:MAG: hypothetical protein GYA33_03535 [Thermogutta sp.]|nr:hypothetical protein [Thermogutta sp.]
MAFWKSLLPRRTKPRISRRTRKSTRLLLESLEDRQLLSGLGLNDPVVAPLSLSGSGVSGDYLPPEIGVMTTPTVLQSTALPYAPPSTVEAWVDGHTVRFRAEVGDVWQDGSQDYLDSQIITDLIVNDGYVAWTVGTQDSLGRVVARRVGFAVYDTDAAQWIVGQSANLGRLSVFQFENRQGVVSWTVGYPEGSAFVPREIGAAAYDATLKEWKFFQTAGSLGKRTIVETANNEGVVAWTIGLPEGAGHRPAWIGMAYYDAEVHEWKRFQTSVPADLEARDLSVGWQSVAWQAKRPDTGTVQELGAAFFDTARHTWKSTQTSDELGWQVTDAASSPGIQAWVSVKKDASGTVVNNRLTLTAYDSRIGGFQTKTLTLAANQTITQLVSNDSMAAWVMEATDAGGAVTRSLGTAFYDAAQKKWKLSSTSEGTNVRFDNISISNGLAAWTVSRPDGSGGWVQRTVGIAAYDPGRGLWQSFSSPEAANRSIVDVRNHGGIVAWTIGYEDGGSCVARNVGAAAYDYGLGQWQLRLSTHDLATSVSMLEVQHGTFAYSTLNDVVLGTYDRTSQTWQIYQSSNPTTVRIHQITLRKGLAAWSVAYASGFDDTFQPRDVGYGVYDNTAGGWRTAVESFAGDPANRIENLHIEEAAIYFSVGGTPYRRTYDVNTQTWGTGDPTTVSRFVVTPAAVPLNRSVVFMNASIGYDDVLYDYGDGYFDDAGFHTYSSAGVYTVTQAAFGPAETDTSIQTVAVLPTRTAAPLGTVSTLDLINQSPSSGTLWYSFRVAADGAFTADVSGAGVGAGTQTALVTLDADGLYQLLAADAAHLDYAGVTAGTTYYLMVAGLSGNVDVTLANPATLSLGEPEVAILGTSGDDTIEIGYDRGFYAVLNGVPYELDPLVSRVSFQGRDGNDRVVVHGSDGDDVVTMGVYGGDVGADVTAVGFSVSVRGTEQVAFLGGAGQDVAEIIDTPFDDVFTGRLGSSVLEGGGFRFEAAETEIVHAYRRNGGDDVADLYDTDGKDFLVGTPLWSRITSADYDYFVRAKGFAEVRAHALDSGLDSAELRDSAGDDTFIAAPQLASMAGHRYKIQADGFEQMVGRSLSGGNDVAYLRGSDGAESLSGAPGAIAVAGGDFAQAAYGFRETTVYSMGGSDSASITDTAGDDEFVMAPRLLTFQAGGHNLRIQGYARTEVTASQGGNDVVHIYDSAGDDNFGGGRGAVTMTGRGYTLTANLFDYVHAYSLAGGNDQAALQDSAGDEIFVGRPTLTRLSGSDYTIRLREFEQVDATSDNGGNDYALLYDSDVADHLAATAFGLEFSGGPASQSFRYRVHGFSQVRAVASDNQNTKSVDPAALAYLSLTGQW